MCIRDRLVRAQMRENLDELERLAAAGSDRARVQGLRQWEADLFPRLEALMAERLASGRVRECHGDLHLGNVAQIDGRATVFDAIEFNDEFRWIDVKDAMMVVAGPHSIQIAVQKSFAGSKCLAITNQADQFAAEGKSGIYLRFAI